MFSTALISIVYCLISGSAFFAALPDDVRDQAGECVNSYLHAKTDLSECRLNSLAILKRLERCKDILPTRSQLATPCEKSSNISVEYWSFGDLRFTCLTRPESEFRAGFISGFIARYLPWLIIGFGYVL